MKLFPIIILLLITSCSRSGGGSSSPARTEGQTETSSQSEIKTPQTDLLKEIENPTDSSLKISDSAQILVGPSHHDKIQFYNARNLNANFGFCKELGSYFEMCSLSENQKQSIESLSIKIEQRIKDQAPYEEIKSLEDQLKYKKEVYKRSLISLSNLQKTFTQEAGLVNMKWESNWEKNIKTLQQLNPDFTFVPDEAPANVKVKLQVNGLPYYPADKMILNFNELAGLTENADGTFDIEQIRDTPLSFAGNATLFSACPLRAPAPHEKLSKNQIEIDVTYNF